MFRGKMCFLVGAPQDRSTVVPQCVVRVTEIEVYVTMVKTE